MIELQEPTLVGVKARLFTYILFAFFSLVIFMKVSMCIYCRFPGGLGLYLTPIGAIVGCFLIELTTRMPFEPGHESSSIWGAAMAVWGLAFWTVVYVLCHQCIHDQVLANSATSY